MSEHSGMNRKEEKMEEKKEVVSDGFINIEAEETKKLKDLWENENKLLSQLSEITLQWDKIKNDTREARRARDLYCLSIEKKYGVKDGAQWGVDFEKGGLVVKPVNPVKPFHLQK